MANNSRFLLLADQTSPNLDSAVLSRATSRLSGDWTERYGHPVLVVETFVDPQRFRGIVYNAANWTPRANLSIMAKEAASNEVRLRWLGNQLGTGGRMIAAKSVLCIVLRCPNKPPTASGVYHCARSMGS